LIKTTNIQKPPVYKQVLPRVLEVITNNEYNNNRDKNKCTKLPLSPPLLKLPLSKFSVSRLPMYDVSLVSENTIKDQRQSRIDQILEKYRRQPSNSASSRQFSRSFSYNTTTDSTLLTDSNLLPVTKPAIAGGNSEGKKMNSGPRSVSPYALFDHSDSTSTASPEIRTNISSKLLSKSYSLKNVGEYRVHTLDSIPSNDYRSISKLICSTTLSNNDDDPPSSSSSTITTTSNTSKSTVLKEDTNHGYSPPTLVDWAIGNCSKESVSDRIKRRSFYVKLK